MALGVLFLYIELENRDVVLKNRDTCLKLKILGGVPKILGLVWIFMLEFRNLK